MTLNITAGPVLRRQAIARTAEHIAQIKAGGTRLFRGHNQNYIDARSYLEQERRRLEVLQSLDLAGVGL